MKYAKDLDWVKRIYKSMEMYFRFFFFFKLKVNGEVTSDNTP